MGLDVMDIFAKIGIESSEFYNGIDQAAQAASGFGDRVKSIFSAAGKAVAVGLTAASGAAVAFGGTAVNVGMTFDSSMAQVAATMGKTVDEITDLRDFAQEMGAKTAFSASQAADALNFMALAGYDAETSMTMLPNVLNLAAAGGMALADASDMITDSQTALGLSLEETAEMVDMMAAASSKSNTSVKQLGDAILTVGSTARDLAGGTNELNTVLGVLADNSIKGAEGGTHLRNIIQAMNPTTKAAKEAFKELKVEAYEDGKLRALPDIFQDMSAAMEGMSDQEKASIKSAIFGVTDLAAASALLETPIERWEELSTALTGAWYNSSSLSEELSRVGLDLTAMQDNLSALGISGDAFNNILAESGGNADLFADLLWDAADAGVGFEDIVSALGGDLESLGVAFDATSGAAQAMADTQLDNLAGDITLFKSALEGAQIVVSDQLTPGLRSFVQLATEGITNVTDAFKGAESVKRIAEGFRDAEGAMRPVGDIAAELRETLSGMTEGQRTDAIQTLFNTDDMEEVNSLLSETGERFDELQAALESVDASGMQDGFSAAMEVLPDVINNGIGTIMSGIPRVVEVGGQILGAVATGIVTNLPVLASGAMQIVSELGKGIIDAGPSLMTQLSEQGGQIIAYISDGVTEALPALAEKAVELAPALAQGLVEGIPATAESIAGGIEELAVLIGDNAESFIEAGTTLFSGFGEGFSSAVSQLLPTIAETGTSLIDTLISAVSGNIGSLIDSAAEIVNGFIDGLSSALPSLADGGMNIIIAVGEGIIQALPKIADSAVQLMQNFGQYIADNGPTLVKRGLELVENLSGSIRENAGKLVDGGIEMLKNLAQGFADSIPTMIEHIPTIVSNIAGVINDNAPKLLSAGVSILITIGNGLIKAIPTLVANIPKILQAIYDVFTAFNWLALGTKVITLIGNGIKALATNIPNIIKGIIETGGNIVKNFGWGSLGRGIIITLQQGVQALASAIPTALKNIATTAVNWFKSVNWLQVGKDIINGMISGIVSMGSAAVDAVVGVGQSIWNGITGFFGIASPSKKFAWIGQMVDEGFAKGIDDNASKTEEKAAKLAKSVYSAVSTEAERQIKYQRLSLTEQLEIWKEVLSKFEEDTDEWWQAYDKVFDIEEKIKEEAAKAEKAKAEAAEKAEKERTAAAEKAKKAEEERLKAIETAEKEKYDTLQKWAERTTKYQKASTEQQLSMWESILSQFKKGTDQWWSAYDKVFDLREKVAEEAKKAEEARIKDLYDMMKKAAETAIKHGHQTAEEQIQTWKQVQANLQKYSDQWWEIEEKFFDLEETAAEDRRKAEEQAVKDHYDELVNSVERAVKRENLSLRDQLTAWENIMSQFEQGSSYWTTAEEKAFDIREKLLDEYLSNVKSANEEIASLQENYDKELSSRAASIANSYKLFDAVEKQDKVKGKDLTRNLQDQIRSIEKFYGNLEKLEARGVSAELVSEIRNMGVSASAELDALLQMREKELTRYDEAFQKRQELATEIATGELSALKDETDQKIREQLTSVEQIYEESAPLVGEAFPAGLAKGILSGMGTAIDAAIQVAQAVEDAIREKTETHSPSRLFERIAEGWTDGLAQGWEAGYADLKSRIESGMDFQTAVSSQKSGGTAGSLLSRAGNTAARTVARLVLPITLELEGRTVARLLKEYLLEDDDRHGLRLVEATVEA